MAEALYPPLLGAPLSADARLQHGIIFVQLYIFDMLMQMIEHVMALAHVMC